MAQSEQDRESIKCSRIYQFATHRLRDAFGHLKVIGFTAAALPILEAAGIDPDVGVGVVAVDGSQGVGAFIAAAKGTRIWAREPTLRSPV